jgi:hypothetical protein
MEYIPEMGIGVRGCGGLKTKMFLSWIGFCWHIFCIEFQENLRSGSELADGLFVNTLLHTELKH